MLQFSLFFLALLDISIGTLLIFKFPFFPHSIFLYTAYAIGLKGLWSVITSIAGKFYFDFLGLLDIIACACLFLIYFKISFNFFWIIGLITIVKGIWTMLFSF